MCLWARYTFSETISWLAIASLKRLSPWEITIAICSRMSNLDYRRLPAVSIGKNSHPPWADSPSPWTAGSVYDGGLLEPSGSWATELTRRELRQKDYSRRRTGWIDGTCC